MKRYLWIGAFLIILGVGSIQAIRLRKRLKECRGETERKREEVKFWEEMLKIEELKRQLEESKKNDTQTQEFERLIKTAKDVCNAKDDYELNKILKQAQLDKVYNEPWEGDFKDFMKNPENKLKFR